MQFKVVLWIATATCLLTAGLTGCMNSHQKEHSKKEHSSQAKTIGVKSLHSNNRTIAPNRIGQDVQRLLEDMLLTVSRNGRYGTGKPNRTNRLDNDEDVGLDDEELDDEELDQDDDEASDAGNYGAYSKDYTRLGGNQSSGNVIINPKHTIEKVISKGIELKGTPYQRGAIAGHMQKFDSSSFVQFLFNEQAGITLPRTTVEQGEYIKKHSHIKTEIGQLARGDVMFFMSNRGSKATAYSDVDKHIQEMTHVGIYLGNNEVLHTFKEGIGVTITPFRNTHWEYRFLFGGSALNMD